MPPVKIGQSSDEVLPIHQHPTAMGHHRFQFIQGVKTVIGNRLIGERPQSLSRLQLW